MNACGVTLDCSLKAEVRFLPDARLLRWLLCSDFTLALGQANEATSTCFADEKRYCFRAARTLARDRNLRFEHVGERKRTTRSKESHAAALAAVERWGQVHRLLSKSEGLLRQVWNFGVIPFLNSKMNNDKTPKPRILPSRQKTWNPHCKTTQPWTISIVHTSTLKLFKNKSKYQKSCRERL